LRGSFFFGESLEFRLVPATFSFSSNAGISEEVEANDGHRSGRRRRWSIRGALMFSVSMFACYTGVANPVSVVTPQLWYFLWADLTSVQNLFGSASKVRSNLSSNGAVM
jgi:hypothetical protein